MTKITYFDTAIPVKTREEVPLFVSGEDTPRKQRLQGKVVGRLRNGHLVAEFDDIPGQRIIARRLLLLDPREDN
jgi:hypothetical protein